MKKIIITDEEFLNLNSEAELEALLKQKGLNLSREFHKYYSIEKQTYVYLQKDLETENENQSPISDLRPPR